MQPASMMTSSYSIDGYSLATFLASSRNKPSESFMMFALWKALTFLRPRFSA